ncbi:MAG: DUF6067 family protein, partial [Candidatus Micrarchaeaceae archaeon]
MGLFLYGICYSEDNLFWKPYKPDKNTLLLLHFNGTLKDSSLFKNIITSEGECNIVKKGYFGQGLYLNGGFLTIHFKTPFPPGNGPQEHAFTIDMWLKPDCFPESGKFAVIFDRGFLNNQQNNWMQLLLTSNGSLLWEAKNQTGSGSALGIGNGDDFFLSLPGIIKLKHWQHITIVVGASPISGGESDTARVFLNGKNVTSKIYGCDVIGPPSSIQFDGTASIGNLQPDSKPNDENWNGEFGSKQIPEYQKNSFVPYKGYIDEFRIEKGILNQSPIIDNSFIDPGKKRQWPADNLRYFPSKKDLLFYISFNNSINADFARGSNKGWGLKTFKFVPGVRGNGIYINFDKTNPGQLIFPSKDNFSAQAGTILCWIKPKSTLHWPSCIFSRQPCYFSPFQAVTTDYGSGWLYPTNKCLPINQWSYVTWVWDRYIATFYVNGKKEYEVPMQPYADLSMFNPEMVFSFGIDKADYNEFKIYQRPFSREEVRNEYLRYLPNSKFTSLPKIGFHLADFRSTNKLVGSIFSRIGEIPGVVKVKLFLLRNGKKCAETSFPFSSYICTPFIWKLPDTVQSGTFKIVVFFINSKGGIIMFEKYPFPLVRKKYSWLNNNIGEGNYVLKPWKSIKVKQNKIQVVGRNFILSSTGFFKQIKCWGNNLLAFPMQIELVDSKGNKSFLKGEICKIIDNKSVQVSWKAKSKILAGNTYLNITIIGKMCYDGTTKFKLTYTPAKNEPVQLNKFSLIIPVYSKYLKLYLWNVGYLPVGSPTSGWGTFNLKQSNSEIFSSKQAWENVFPGNIVGGGYPRIPTIGNFIPQIWFGNNECGISVFGDNDSGWVPNNDKSAIQVINKGKLSEIRLNFISSNFILTKARTIVFGFLPTPVKPLPKDWRTGKYYGVFGTPFSSGDAYLADYESKRENIPLLREMVEQRKKDGLPNTPHINTTTFDVGFRTLRNFSADWNSASPDMYPYAMLTKSKVDYDVWILNRWKKDLGIDGMYFDCATPQPNWNIFSGTAYLLDNGKVQPGWTIWNERELFKRAAYIFGNLYQENKTWGDGFYGPEICGWEPSTVVGEGCEIFTKDNKELVGRITPKGGWGFVPIKYYSDTIVGNFSLEQIEAVSRQWGIIRLWQAPNYLFWGRSGWEKDPPELIKKVEVFARSAEAQILQLDTRIALGAENNSFPKFYRKFIEKSGLTFYGFWNNNLLFIRKPKDIYISAFTT